MSPRNQKISRYLLLFITVGALGTINASAGDVEQQGPIISVKDSADHSADHSADKDEDDDQSLGDFFPLFELDIAKAEATLVDHLQRLRLPERTDPAELVRFENVSTMIDSVMNAFLNTNKLEEPGLCRHAHSKLLGHCLRRGFRHIIKMAHNDDLVDDVEFENLRAYTRFFQLQEGKFVVIAPKQHFRFVTKWITKLKKKISKRIPLPDLGDYEINKNFFRMRRLSKPQNLSPKGPSESEISGVLRKNYRRKLSRTGRAGPEDYVLSTYSKFQINELAGLMTQTIKMMSSEAGKVVLVSKDYTDLFLKIDDLDAKITDLATAAGRETDPAKLQAIDQEITQTKTQIIEIRKQISFVTLTEQIEAARKKKSELVDKELLEKAVDEKGIAARANLASAIQDQDDLIAGLLDQLAKESIEIKLAQSDIYRFTVHFLDIAIEKKKRAKNESYLYGTNPTYGDIVVASYLAGDLDPTTLTSILSMKELHEPHTSPVIQFGKVMLDISKTVLMIYPTTSVPTTIVVILIQSIQRKNAYEKEMANKTHLF